MASQSESGQSRRGHLNRPRANMYLDALAFMAVLGTVVTGLVLRLVLPEGSGRLEVGGSERPIATLWRFTRHEWGSLHYAISLALLAILAVHLWLHGDWIVSMGKRESQASGKSFGVGLMAALALMAVALSPLWSEPAQQTRFEVMTERGESLSPSEAICYSEGVTLTALDLERVTGVPQSRFLVAARTLGSDETRQIIEDYYATSSSTDDEGGMLFNTQCLRCHENSAALPDLSGADGPALARLRDAKPAAAHQALRSLTDAELLSLLHYLRASRKAD